MKKVLRKEKRILTDILKMYKDSPCLWDVTDPFYTNKIARKRALSCLAEKYKEVDGESNILLVRKKIDNLRANYRRERLKVIKSKLHGGEEYKPLLWYYPMLTFLEQLEPRSPDENSSEVIEPAPATESIWSQNDEHDDIILLESEADNSSLEPETSSEAETRAVKIPKPRRIYIKTDQEYNNDAKEPSAKKSKISKDQTASDDDVTPLPLPKRDPEQPAEWTENDLFGWTISAQLRELPPKQKFIAQKLMSEVIYFARMGRLRPDTKLRLGDT